MRLSVIIPAYDEEDRIKPALMSLSRFLDANFRQEYEVIVVTDGCTDRTPHIVAQMARKNSKIVALDYQHRLGKGGAIKEALGHAKGEFLILYDADGSAPPSNLKKLMSYLEDYDLVIGSRYRSDSKVVVKEPTLRVLLSRAFNVLLKLLFPQLLKIRDTQCGLKAIRRSVIRKVQNDLFITGFAFDVNLVCSALRHGFRVKEVGVTWLHKERGSKASGRLLKLAIAMFFSIVKLRLHYSRFRIALDRKLMRSLSGFIWKLTT